MHTPFQELVGKSIKAVEMDRKEAHPLKSVIHILTLIFEDGSKLEMETVIVGRVPGKVVVRRRIRLTEPLDLLQTQRMSKEF